MQDKYEATMPNDYPTNFDGAAFSSERHQQQPSFEGVSGDGLQSDHLPTITTPRLQSEQTQVPAQKTKISSDLPMIAYSQQVQARPSSRLQEPAPQQTSMLRNYGDKTSDDLRQLAKGALLSLAPHSIHYAELLKEGIDDKILHQLYEELGIEIPAAKVDTSTTSSMEVDDPQPPTSLSAPHKEASQGMDVSALNVPTSSSSIGKPTPVPSPSMERKDRIAQLLAAKTGRPSPVRAFSESATSAGATEQRSTNEAPPNKDNDAVAASPTTQPKSKDVLQAEALKEKMDKLRSESWAAVPLERMNTDGSMSLAKMESANNALQISTQQLPQEAGPLSSIPGLFMTSADPMRIDNIFGTSFGAQSEPIDPSRPSLKRPFEHEVQLSEVEPDAKRRNTETTSDAMDIDRSAESNNAPEGDIISAGKDGPSASDPQSTLQTTAAMLPVSQHTAVFPAPLNPTSIASSQVQPTANQSKTRLTSAQIAEKAEMLKARFLKQRAERQKALQDGLPDLDAEVQKTRTRLVQQQSQLSQVKLQIGKLDAELVEARTQESTLSEEIAQLEKHLKEGVSGQMQYVDELRNLKTDHDTSEQVSRTAPASQQTPPQPTTDVEEVPLIVADEAQESTDRNLTTGPRVQSAEISDGEVSMTSPDSSSENVQPADIEGESNVSEPADLNESPFVGSTVDEHQTPILQNSEILEAELPKPPIPDVPVNGDVPDYVPEPNAVGIDGESDHGEFEHQSDGSASMSDSGSDIGDDEEGEYEPEDEEAPQSNDAEGSEEGEYDPEEIQIEQPVEDGQNDDVEMVEDEYDPELDEAAKDSQAPSSQMSEEMVDSPPARPVENAGQDMKAAEQVIVEAAITPPGEDELLVVAEEPITTLVVSQPSTGVGMPAIASPAPSQEPILTSTASNGTSHASYAPYQSPLSSFQSYRYNEQFKAAAPTAGYRSLTYSNNIDPNVPLCHTELAGGVCEDPTCEDQHFRYLGLSGNANSADSSFDFAD